MVQLQHTPQIERRIRMRFPLKELEEIVDAGFTVTFELSGEEANKYAGRALAPLLMDTSTQIGIVSTGETIEESIKELYAKYISEE